MQGIKIIILIIILVSSNTIYAEKEIKYNSEKGYYEVWDKERGELIEIILGGGISLGDKLLFPNQKGFPSGT